MIVIKYTSEGEKEGDSYTFTITLASDKSYDYCFYADNGTANITDLRNITWPNTGNVVAYAHVLSGKPEEEVTLSVTLKHIVTKITLKHIGDPFTVTADEEFKISFPCADTFNVLNNAASTGNGYENFTYTFAEEKTINDGDEVCSFYTIVPADVDDWSDITLDLHQLTQTISGIEWKSNSHVTLQGDLSEDNPKWGATSEYEKGSPGSDGIYRFYLPTNDLNKLESVIGAIFHKEVKIQLNFGTVFDKTLGDDFNLHIYYDNNGSIVYLNIFVNGKQLCAIAYVDVNYNEYENFSVVSDVLNQSTK